MIEKAEIMGPSWFGLMNHLKATKKSIANKTDIKKTNR